MDAQPRYPHYMAHNACCTPDWRWQRAQLLVAQHRNFSRPRDDGLTGRAVHYLRDLARRPKELAKTHPEIWGAHELYKMVGWAKALVEARILARQSSAEIAALSGIPLDVVDIFESLFFNVRNRLHARDWVATHIWEREPAAKAVLMMFAFFGGPLVLDVVIPYLVNGKDLYEPTLGLTTEDGRLDQAVRLAVATYLLPNDAKTGWKLSKIALILHQRGRKASRPASFPPLLIQNLESRIEEAVSKGTPEIADRASTESVLEPARETKQTA